MPPPGVRNRDWSGTTEPLPLDLKVRAPRPVKQPRHRRPTNMPAKRDPRTGLLHIGMAGRETLPAPVPGEWTVPPWVGPSSWEETAQTA